MSLFNNQSSGYALSLHDWEQEKYSSWVEWLRSLVFPWPARSYIVDSFCHRAQVELWKILDEEASSMIKLKPN